MLLQKQKNISFLPVSIEKLWPSLLQSKITIPVVDFLKLTMKFFFIDLEIQGVESALKTTQLYLEKTTQLLLDYCQRDLYFNLLQEKIEKDRKKIQQLEEELSGFRKEQRKLQQEKQELIVRITCQENRRL